MHNMIDGYGSVHDMKNRIKVINKGKTKNIKIRLGTSDYLYLENNKKIY